MQSQQNKQTLNEEGWHGLTLVRGGMNRMSFSTEESFQRWSLASTDGQLFCFGAVDSKDTFANYGQDSVGLRFGGGRVITFWADVAT